MEFLRAVGRFILAQLAILGFLLLAPAILVGVSLFAIAGGAGSNPGFLAFFYMAAGPFVSAVWTAFFMSLRRVLRTTTFGNRTAASCGMRVQIASCGWALVGFLGTIAAEVCVQPRVPRREQEPHGLLRGRPVRGVCPSASAMRVE